MQISTLHIQQKKVFLHHAKERNNMKTNKQISQDHRAGKCIITLNIEEFYNKDEKIDKLRIEEISTADFVELIEETDPYSISMLDDDWYLIQNKNTAIAITTYVTEEKKREFYKNYDIVQKVYPELSAHLNDITGCSNCKGYGHGITTISYMAKLGGVDRNLGALIPILGKGFAKKLSTIKGNPDFRIENHHMHQCHFCTFEHLTKAQVYFGEWLKDNIIYKLWWGYTVGQLAAAEIECIHINNKLSKMIRVEKKAMEKSRKYIPDFDTLILKAMDAI
jgi:hypothetical protein